MERMPNMSHKTSSDVESHQDEPAPLLLTRVTRPPQGRDAERGTISGTYARAEGGVTGVRTSEAREEEDRAFLEENNELTAKIAEMQKELMGAQEKLAEASREADLWQEVLDEADGRVTDAFQALPMESGEAGLQLAEHDLLRWAKARNLMGRKDQWAGQKQKESILSAYTQEALQQDASGKTPELLEQYSFALERKDTAMAQYAVVEQAARPSLRVVIMLWRRIKRCVMRLRSLKRNVLLCRTNNARNRKRKNSELCVKKQKLQRSRKYSQNVLRFLLKRYKRRKKAQQVFYKKKHAIYLRILFLPARANQNFFYCLKQQWMANYLRER